MSDITVAIMQPYWVPYAGYFRLFEAADVFIVLDTVQFPRRGYVHRNKLLSGNGTPEWLTLPLKKAPRDVKISDLEFHPDAAALFEEQRGKFPVLDSGFGLIDEEVSNLDGSIRDFLIVTLKLFQSRLTSPCEWVLASQLPDPCVSGQDRILKLVQEVGGNRYLNSPGGGDLYSQDLFDSNGVELCFLEPWSGSNLSILQECSSTEGHNEIRRAIINQSKFQTRS